MVCKNKTKLVQKGGRELIAFFFTEWNCSYVGATTPLHFAAQRGYTGAVMDLVEFGAQVPINLIHIKFPH